MTVRRTRVQNSLPDFWSLALALRAARPLHAPGTIRPFDHLPRNLAIAARRSREVLA